MFNKRGSSNTTLCTSNEVKTSIMYLTGVEIEDAEARLILSGFPTREKKFGYWQADSNDLWEYLCARYKNIIDSRGDVDIHYLLNHAQDFVERGMEIGKEVPTDY